MSKELAPASPHRWRFFRSGGFDQVRLETAQDLENLGQLDQKLWSVLGCPTTGLEFDSRTLALIDGDGDGQIRSPEIVAAVRWVCDVLKDPAILFKDGDTLALVDFDTDHPEGAKLAASARQILAYMGKPDADTICLEDVSDLTKLFTPDHYNGDGIVPAELAESPELRELIGKIIECCGGETDRSGASGIDAEKLEAFFAQAKAFVAWWEKADAGTETVLPLGPETAAAALLVEALKPKIDDYFTRCQLAAFDLRATESLNPASETYAALAEQSISAASSQVASLPLAKIAADASLPLSKGVNPAWAGDLARFRDEVVAPIMGERDSLTAAEWASLSARFDAYRAWMSERPDTPVNGLEPAFLKGVIADGSQAALAGLIERDKQSETAAESVECVERVLRYRRDLVTLLNNFVSLTDFYSKRKKAIFQAGTLYLDQRSCELCMRVSNMDKHSTLAPFSGTYLVYCSCQRKDELPITIVAAMTGGEVDELLVPGRNGVFYDRQGRDWNATVAKVVENPVSVRQAFWSPYRRIGRMIGEQIQKFAAAREKAVDDKAAASVATTAAKADGPVAPAAPPVPFDIAKFAGIFAAIGLALGAIGTALAAVVGGLLSLPIWQLPLVVVGVMFLISGPSMLLAWLKLRQRNLGPLLDANGWAVNTRARINIPFGGSLTGLATLPKGASRSLDDPYAEKRTPWKRYVFLIVLIAVIAGLWQQGVLQMWIERARSVTEAPSAAVEPAPAADKPAAAPAPPAVVEGPETALTPAKE
jgi:hypothetical protein